MISQEAKTLGIIGIATILLLGGAVWFLSGNSNSSQSQQNTSPIEQSKLVTADSHQSATDSAKVRVTLVEFADFQCPACADASSVVSEIKNQNPETVNVVFRHFPLNQHKNAFPSARAAEAAGEQNKFWEMYQKLFAGQKEWFELSDPKPLFVTYAQEMGLDMVKFEESFQSNKFDDKINKDYSEGSKLGVNSTPTFYLNGQKVNLSSYSQLKTKVEAALK